MKRLLCLLLGLVGAGSLVWAAPAEAGWYYWETNPCRPDIYWTENENSFQYHRATDPWDTTDYTYRVFKFWPSFAMSNAGVYQKYGWQCGVLGAPTQEAYLYTQGWFYQPFERGWLWFQEVPGTWYICTPDCRYA